MIRPGRLWVTAFAAGIACSVEPAPAPAGAAAPAPAPVEAPAADELDRLDARAPVPLLPAMAHHQKQSMRDHLVAVQEMAVALSMSDFPGVERAAARIGFSEQMGQMCTHMGMGAPGFAEQAVEFHKTADRIAAAARARDGASVLAALSETLQTCTSCHAVWKQQVVDEPTWRRLTSLAPSPSSRR